MDTEAQLIETPDSAGPDLEAILATEDVAPPAEEPATPAEPAAPAQAAPAQLPPTPPAAPAQDDPRTAEGLAAIMREARELQEARRQLDEERAKLEPLRKYESLQRMLEEEDAEGALRELGVDLDRVNRAVVEGRGAKPFASLQRQIEQKLEEIERGNRERVERLERAEMERARAEAVNETRRMIAPDRFPLTSAVGDLGVEAVFSKVQEHFQRDGKVPTYDQVIDEVEKELVSFVDRLMANETVKQRYLGQAAPPAKTPSPTLTNDAAATVSKRKAPQTDSLPDNREDAIEFILAQET